MADEKELGTIAQSGQDVFVARQPIFDARKRLHAYELLFRGGLDNFCPPGDANDSASQVLRAAWLTFGLPSLIGPNKAFTNFTRELLVAGYGEALPSESTVIELLETVDGDPEVVEACQRLKDRGYTIALDDFVYRSGLDALIPMVDVVKIGFRDSDPVEQAEHVRRVAPHGPKLLAEMVETEEEYQHAKELGFTYFQGYFFCRPEVMQRRAVSGARYTYLKLLQCVTKADFDIDELDAVIRADVSVTHRLMRYLGSAAFGFRAEVRNIRHGLALLGREQTRRFVSLVALGAMGSEKPLEILITAAARAKFCESPGADTGMGDRKPDLFLLGALSLIDAMLDQPMSTVVEELPLSDDLKGALQGHQGPLRPVLDFVECYERGDWTTCATLQETHGIEGPSVFGRYRDAAAWATAAWHR